PRRRCRQAPRADTVVEIDLDQKGLVGDVQHGRGMTEGAKEIGPEVAHLPLEVETAPHGDDEGHLRGTAGRDGDDARPLAQSPQADLARVDLWSATEELDTGQGVVRQVGEVGPRPIASCGGAAPPLIVDKGGHAFAGEMLPQFVVAVAAY